MQEGSLVCLERGNLGHCHPTHGYGKAAVLQTSDVSRDLRTELSPEERMKSHMAAEGDVPPGEGGTGEWHHASPCLPASCLDTKLPASPGSPESFAYKKIGNWGFVGKPRSVPCKAQGVGATAGMGCSEGKPPSAAASFAC